MYRYPALACPNSRGSVYTGASHVVHAVLSREKDYGREQTEEKLRTGWLDGVKQFVMKNIQIYITAAAQNISAMQSE